MNERHSTTLFQASANRSRVQEFSCADFDAPVVGTIYPRCSVGWHGVPLGGLGTGYVCWDSDGRFSQHTIYNQVPPASDVPQAGGVPFTLVAEGRTFVLAMRDEQGQGDLRDLRYFGHFPIVDMQLEVDLPLGLEVRAYAPFIPGDAVASHTPAIIFEVHLRNQSERMLDLTLTFAPPAPPKPIVASTEFAEGAWTGIMAAHPWPAAGPRLGSRPITHQLGVAVEQGVVEMRDGIPTARLHASLAAGQQLVRRFILSWHQPYLRDSKLRAERLRYADRFADAAAVTRHAIAHHRGWLRRIIAWQQVIYRRESLSPALREALVNAPYALCKNTHWISRWRPDDWFPEDGLLLTNESYTTCPISETLPCHYLGNFPVLLFFPELERTALEAYRHFQLRTGEIPFALERGFGARSPYYQMQHSNGIGEYIELIHRYWARTGDTDFLRDFYHSARLAFDYLMFLDYDDDGLVNEHPHALPEEAWPANVPWDRWCQYDTGAYTAIKGIAATLSLARMAEQVGDEGTVARCRERVERGRGRLEERLWNGRYYRLWADKTGDTDESCLLAQVSGAWGARLLGLEPPIPVERLQAALEAIVRLTEGQSPFGLVLAGSPDGDPVYANDALRCDFARDVWPVYNFILAATCAQHGLCAAEGLQAAHRVIEALFRGANNMPWGWPCNLHGFTGWIGHGHDYNDPQAIWTIPLAIEGHDLTMSAQPESLVGAILRAAAPESGREDGLEDRM